MKGLFTDSRVTAPWPCNAHQEHLPLAKAEGTCGRRERGSRREGRREQSLRVTLIPSRVVTVKGIPVFGKASLFAGLCRNEGLGRSDSGRGQSSRDMRRADDSGCPKDAEEGNAVSMRDLCVCTHHRHERSCMRLGTRPSLGPSTRARRSSLCSAGKASEVRRAISKASRLGKLAKARGTNTGAFGTGRSAARHVSPLPQGRGRDTLKKRKEIEVSVPARIKRSPGLVARTS